MVCTLFDVHLEGMALFSLFLSALAPNQDEAAGFKDDSDWCSELLLPMLPLLLLFSLNTLSEPA